MPLVDGLSLDSYDDTLDCWHPEDRPYRPHSPRHQTRADHRHSLRSAIEPAFVRFPFSGSALFDSLVAQWREDAVYESMTHRVAMLPAYQAMVGMGSHAVPLILARLKDDPSPHWFWALRAITREDPAASEDTVRGAVNAWLRWDASRGRIPD